jgi:uncharacterized protein YsxB (DUF464 family)
MIDLVQGLIMSYAVEIVCYGVSVFMILLILDICIRVKRKYDNPNWYIDNLHEDK